MKQYLLLFRGGLNFATATPEEIQQAMMNWKTWMDELQAQGKLTPGNRLMKTGRVLTGKKRELTDGPYTEGKEIVGGYVSIAANDMDEATRIAHGCPIFNYDGIVEIREVIAS